MRYMVLKHSTPALERQDLWYVADMEHSQQNPCVIKKSLRDALIACGRMNNGVRFWDSSGTILFEERAAAEFERLKGIIDRRNIAFYSTYVPGMWREVIRYMTGLEWEEWATRWTYRSRRALDLT